MPGALADVASPSRSCWPWHRCASPRHPGSRRRQPAHRLHAADVGGGRGLPRRKTPKGVSCADGDVCDLDGQRNGVCLFQVSLCLNQPTRACQPRSVKRATVKAKTKSGVDVTSLQAALAAIPLPTSDTVCSAAALISVPTRGPGGHGRVRSRKVALKASAKAGSHKDSDTYRLTCVPTTVGGGPTATTTRRPSVPPPRPRRPSRYRPLHPAPVWCRRSRPRR